MQSSVWILPHSRTGTRPLESMFQPCTHPWRGHWPRSGWRPSAGNSVRKFRFRCSVCRPDIRFAPSIWRHSPAVGKIRTNRQRCWSTINGRMSYQLRMNILKCYLQTFQTQRFPYILYRRTFGKAGCTRAKTMKSGTNFNISVTIRIIPSKTVHGENDFLNVVSATYS